MMALRHREIQTVSSERALNPNHHDHRFLDVSAVACDVDELRTPTVIV